jgi:homoserine dehydrogenase
LASLTVGLAGFGLVGRAFAEMLAEKRQLIRERYGVRLSLVFIADSRGAAVDCAGLDWRLVGRLTRLPRGAVSSAEGVGRPGLTVGELVEECRPDILVDATPSIYMRRPVQLEWALEVLGYGGAVVFADKAPMAVACGQLLSGSKGRRVFYKATVMAGTPLIDMLRYGFSGRRVVRVRGALNGTCNYLLWLAAEKGLGLSEALSEAAREGYAEPNPELDVNGVDLAAKAAILSCTLGFEATLWDVEVADRVDGRAMEWAVEARHRGARLRYVATVEPGRRLRVHLEEVGAEDPLYHGGPAENVAVVESEEAGRVAVYGPGAGARATAASLLSDLANAARELAGV